MNLLHLKYAVVIAETNSMTQAAQRLYTAQPNLSRAIRELESGLGISIFKRTSKGIFPTPEGQEFLGYARKILKQVDEVEAIFKHDKKPVQNFSISVPRASYISCAFTEFVKKLDKDIPAEIFYKETNSKQAISYIVNDDYRLGILRYQTYYDKYFKQMIQEKDLKCELIYEFKYVIVVSKDSPLAKKESVRINELTPLTEIAHADPYVPSLPLSTVRKNELSDVNRHIFVFERASQMQLLSESPNTFMWVSPIPQQLLDRFGLVQLRCEENAKEYRDILIYRNDYSLSVLDKLFIDELTNIRRQLEKSQ